MDFRLLGLALILFLPQVAASPMKGMDKLVPLVYQYPTQAAEKIEQLDSSKFTFREKLRLELIKCELLNQNGDGQAAINLAQLAIAQAKSNQLEEALPYFYICMADAYSSVGQFNNTFTLLDDAIAQSKQLLQPQSLVNALRTRAHYDTEFEDFNSAIEDLRLAIDVHPKQFTQKYNWFWAPEAYIYATMANMLFASNELNSSLRHIKTALNVEDSVGIVRHFILLSAARMNFDAGNIEKSELYLREAKMTLFDVESEEMLAISKAIIASLELDNGNLVEAESLLLDAIQVFRQLFKVTHTMRANKLLAKMKFAQGKDKEALEISNIAIDQATQLKQYTDLQIIYHTLEKYYLSIGNTEKAYHNLKLAHEAGNNANKVLNSARFIQYKARLDRQASLHSQQRQSATATSKSEPNESKAYQLIIFVFVMLGVCIFFVLFQSKRQQRLQQEQAKQELPINEELNKILIAAKKQASPLSLLLVDVEKLNLAQLESLQHGITDVVRESDIVSRYSPTDLLILLPNTTNAGAQKVVANLHRHLRHVTNKDHIFGTASMQQFDQIEQLIKRANFDRLTHIKNREIRTTKFDDVQAG